MQKNVSQVKKKQSPQPMTFSRLQEELKDILPTGEAYKALDEAIKSEANDLRVQIDCYTKYNDAIIKKIDLIKVYDDNIKILINKSSTTKEQAEKSLLKLKTQIKDIENLIVNIKTPSQNFLIDTIKSSHKIFDKIAKEMNIDCEQNPSYSIKTIGELLKKNSKKNLHDILEDARLEQIKNLQTALQNNTNEKEVKKLTDLDDLFQNRTGRTFFRLFGKPSLQAVLNEIGIEGVNAGPNNGITEEIKIALVKKFGNSDNARDAFQASCANRYNMYSVLYKQIASLKQENDDLKSKNKGLENQNQGLENQNQDMKNDIKNLLSTKTEASEAMKEKYLSAKDKYEIAMTTLLLINNEQFFLSSLDEREVELSRLLQEGINTQQANLDNALKQRKERKTHYSQDDQFQQTAKQEGSNQSQSQKSSNRPQSPKPGAQSINFYQINSARPSSSQSIVAQAESLIASRRNSNQSQGSGRSQQ